MRSQASCQSEVNRSALYGLLHSRMHVTATEGGDAEPVAPLDYPDQRHRPRRTQHLIFRLAIHEASHAVIRLHLGLGTITKVTIDAPFGGYVTWRTDELHEQTEEFFTAVLAATLAGRAGEEVFMESVGAGGGGDRGASDQAIATQIAFDMETAMGFGKKWPLLYRATADPQLLLAIDQELSERVHARLTSAYDAARKMIVKQRPAVENLAEALLVHGTLEGPGLENVLAGTRKLFRE
jgi:ATP-dependent Zn protease